MLHGNYTSEVGIKTACPFVCLIMPFIRFKRALVNPFICSNIPLVGIKGFTMIELIITMTIVGIMVALAAPGMQSFVSNNRLTTQVNELLTDISHARSEAIIRSTTAGVCVTDVGGDTCVSSGNWANGRLVYYVCPSTDTTCTTGSNVAVKIHEAMTNDNTLDSPSDAIIFNKTGLLSSGAGQFTLTDPKTGGKRIVCLGTTGRPALSKEDCPS